MMSRDGKESVPSSGWAMLCAVNLTFQYFKSTVLQSPPRFTFAFSKPCLPVDLCFCPG